MAETAGAALTPGAAGLNELSPLTPAVKAFFEDADYEDGDTAQLPTPPPVSETRGAKRLLAVFDAPEDDGIPAEFRGEDLKAAALLPAPPADSESDDEPDVVEPKASQGLGLYKPALALWLTCSALLATSAAAFACARRSARRGFCGQPLLHVPRGRRTRRRAALVDASNDTRANAAAFAAPAFDLFAAVTHEDPAMDPADARAVVAAVRARRSLGAYRDVLEAQEDPDDLLAGFEADYGAASRAHVLDVRAHVLTRPGVEAELHADPARDLVDAVVTPSGYSHAYERSPSEVVEANGGFVLGLRAHVLRGAEGLLHANPAIDLEDVLSVKAKARELKLRARLAADRR